MLSSEWLASKFLAKYWRILLSLVRSQHAQGTVRKRGVAAIEDNGGVRAILLNLNGLHRAHYQWRWYISQRGREDMISPEEITDSILMDCTARFGRWIDHLRASITIRSTLTFGWFCCHQHSIHKQQSINAVLLPKNHWLGTRIHCLSGRVCFFFTALTVTKFILLWKSCTCGPFWRDCEASVLDESFDHRLRNLEPLNLYCNIWCGVVIKCQI